MKPEENEMPYAYSPDDKTFRGDYPTPEDAARAAFAENHRLEGVVYVGKKRTVTAHDFVIGGDVIYEAMEFASNECGEVAAEWLTHLRRNPEKVKELETIIGDWLQANDPPLFWVVDNPRLIHRRDTKCQQS